MNTNAEGLGDLQSPDVPPGADFDEEELRVYEYICRSYRAAGVEHMTTGLGLAVVTRTYTDWRKASRRCDIDGRTQTSQKTGWTSPTPWAEDERRLKEELVKCLHKMGLTVTSATRVRKDSGAHSPQDDLFGELVQHGQSSPQSALLN